MQKWTHIVEKPDYVVLGICFLRERIVLAQEFAGELVKPEHVVQRKSFDVKLVLDGGKVSVLARGSLHRSLFAPHVHLLGRYIHLSLQVENEVSFLLSQIDKNAGKG